MMWKVFLIGLMSGMLGLGVVVIEIDQKSTLPRESISEPSIATISRACAVYDRMDGIHIVAMDPIGGDPCEVVLPKGIRPRPRSFP